MNVFNEGYTYETNGDVDVVTPSFLKPTRTQVKSVRKDGVLVSESRTVYGFLDKFLWKIADGQGGELECFRIENNRVTEEPTEIVFDHEMVRIALDQNIVMG